MPDYPLVVVYRAYVNEKEAFYLVHFIFNLYETKNDKIVLMPTNVLLCLSIGERDQPWFSENVFSFLKWKQ